MLGRMVRALAAELGMWAVPDAHPASQPRRCRAVPCCKRAGSALAHCQAGKQAGLGEGRVHP